MEFTFSQHTFHLWMKLKFRVTSDCNLQFRCFIVEFDLGCREYQLFGPEIKAKLFESERVVTSLAKGNLICTLDACAARFAFITFEKI